LRGTNFQIQVWEALLRIPLGQVTTYQSIATAIGSPKATRAVGTAIGKNPVPLLIPCHRVIRATGEFGKYAFGSERKKAILGWEMAQNISPRSSDFSRS
jgi:AraC family transcriptional regulator of adaptative response/methylated-DNA-[protein]-cysteine methyltransferase